MSDRLTLKGLGAADGEYEFDLSGLVNVGGAEALTLREQQRIKVLSGYRGLEIREAVAVLDPAVMVALVDVIVTRGGQTLNVAKCWDAKFLYTAEDEVADLSPYRIAIDFHMGGLEDEDPTMGDGEPAAVGAEGEEVEDGNPPV